MSAYDSPALALPEETLTCTECGREATEAEAEEEGWRFHIDGDSELMPFCAECAEREFGD
jgi:hypothetical protein